VSEGVLLTVAYDGTPFSGWAPQTNARTIAGELLAAVRALRPEVREVRGASRTDAGVHAMGQRAAFDVDAPIPPRGWVLGLGSHLPVEIAVRAASRVAPGFTPRFRSTGKRYIYTLLLDPARDPFWDRRALRVPQPLDLEAMAAEAATAIGCHDFRAFRASADERRETVRTIRSFALRRDPTDARLVRLVVEGDRFLYNMVRILSGSLVDVGLGRLRPGAFARALASGERSDLGPTAPAHGLLLDEVFLDTTGDDLWPGAATASPTRPASSPDV
jgi:tRNA pseudouridine38-40 synthase